MAFYWMKDEGRNRKRQRRNQNEKLLDTSLA